MNKNWKKRCLAAEREVIALKSKIKELAMDAEPIRAERARVIFRAKLDDEYER